MIKSFMKRMIRITPSETSGKLKTSMIVNGICKPVSVVIAYLYVPFVLKFLGIEKYGVWSTLLAILTWIGYFDLGIGNGLRNRLTESLSNDRGQSRELVSSAYFTMSVVMMAVTVVFIFLASLTDFDRLFGGVHVQEDMFIVVTVCIITVSASFVLSLCNSILYALQRAAVVSIVSIVVQLLNLAGVVIASRFLTGNLLAMALIYGLSMLLSNLAANIILFTRHKKLSPSLKCLNITTGQILIKMGMSFFIIQICALILYTTDSFLISYLYGASEVTPYSIVNKLYEVIISIFAAFLTPVWSYITKMYSEGRYKDIVNLRYASYQMALLFILGAALLTIFFRVISYWWLKEDLQYPDSLIFCGGTYCALTIWCNTNAFFTNAMGILRLPKIVAIVQAMINIPLSLFFAEVLNLRTSGVFLGTIVTMVIPSFVLPKLITKTLKTKMRTQSI